jgi:hypothetical protein
VYELRSRRLETPAIWHEPRNIGDAIELAIAWTSVLNTWERGFITNLAGRRGLSEKQRDCLVQIVMKIERYHRATQRLRGLAA